jgi:hypothetical protein
MEKIYNWRFRNLQFLSLLVFQFLLISFSINSVRAQESLAPPRKNSRFVTDVVKLLSSQTDITSLTGPKEVYAFNLRVMVERKANKINVSSINISDSIGYRIFPIYQNLKKIDYRELLIGKGKATLVIPVLILNNPFDNSNPEETLKSITKRSITELISDLIYSNSSKRNLSNEDITLFDVFVVSRIDIEKR